MEVSDTIHIYECFDQGGDPSHYVCWGHVDSERFREECFKEYSVRPLVVQHRWQTTRKVLFTGSAKKRVHSRFDNVQSPDYVKNAQAVTIGIAPVQKTDPKMLEIEIH
jgi:hypothetical protein